MCESADFERVRASLAGPVVVFDACSKAGSHRFQKETSGSQDLSAAALRLALASAGAEELRRVSRSKHNPVRLFASQVAVSWLASGHRARIVFRVSHLPRAPRRMPLSCASPLPPCMQHRKPWQQHELRGRCSVVGSLFCPALSAWRRHGASSRRGSHQALVQMYRFGTHQGMFTAPCRMVHEAREAVSSSSSSHKQQQPPVPRQHSAPPPVPLQPEVLLAGRFRRSTTGSGARASSMAADEADNPVRAALNRSFPMSHQCGSTSPTARVGRTFSSGGRTFSSGSLAAVSSDSGASSKAGTQQPATPDAAGEPLARRPSAGSVAEAASAAVAEAQSAWPGSCRSAFGASAASAAPLSTSAVSMSMSGGGDSSNRSSLERTSSQGGRSSMDGGCSSSAVGRSLLDGSAASDRSQCSAAALARSGSLPHTHCSFDSVRTGSSAGGSTASSGGSSSFGDGSLAFGRSLSRRDAALMDADCCGDSGCPMLLARPGVGGPVKTESLPVERYSPPASPSGADRVDSDALGSLLRKQVRATGCVDQLAAPVGVSSPPSSLLHVLTLVVAGGHTPCSGRLSATLQRLVSGAVQQTSTSGFASPSSCFLCYCDRAPSRHMARASGRA